MDLYGSWIFNTFTPKIARHVLIWLLGTFLMRNPTRFSWQRLGIILIFVKFAISWRQGRWKSLLEVADVEARQSCGHEQANSSVSWNLVNWNVEGTQICLSESAPSYGVDSSFIFPILRVLPEPNLRGSVERWDSHLSISTCEPLWTCTVHK